MGGIRFLIYEETVLGRTIIDEREVWPYQIEETRKLMQETVRVLNEDHPDKKFGWQEYVIDSLPPGAPF